jgi:hypothetical protein
MQVSRKNTKLNQLCFTDEDNRRDSYELINLWSSSMIELEFRKQARERINNEPA